MKRSGWLGPVAAVAAPLLVFGYLRQRLSWDVEINAPTSHFYIVSSVALLAIVIGVAIGIAGGRVRNIKISFLSLAFISLAELFMIHGLSTPGFVHHATRLPGLSAQLSVVLASVWLWLSSLSTDHAWVGWLARFQNQLVPVWAIALGIASLISFLFPHTVDLVPLNPQPVQWGITVVVLLLNVSTMQSYYRSYRYSRFPFQLSIVYSAGWLNVAQVIMVFGEIWRLSWWLYHFLLLASMIVMLAGLIKQYAANRSIADAFKALFATDPVERITRLMPPSVKALVVATESRDPYTAGHNFRVAMYALRLAEELGVPPERMRALAMGAIVHDVGKINIPDSILNKPGKLTEDERAVIETHTLKGYEMCRNLGFMKEELEIIRSHHERWNGTGYPDGLKGEQIPLLARITAVADVYDALTSTRAYRQAWSHEEAMRFLTQHQGTQFDPECVQAWIRVCERDPQVYRNWTATDYARNAPSVSVPSGTVSR